MIIDVLCAWLSDDLRIKQNRMHKFSFRYFWYGLGHTSVTSYSAPWHILSTRFVTAFSTLLIFNEKPTHVVILFWFTAILFMTVLKWYVQNPKQIST